MTDTYKPENDAHVREAVAWAVAEHLPLEVIGTGTKRRMGRPVAVGHNGTTLDISGLAGITLYEPEELVLSAGPGTPMADIHAALTERGQELAFEPPDYGPLFGLPAGGGTLGGILGTNLAGPRRLKAGAARDHFLGFRGVSGRGDAFKSGGRVVKNVTGYDLSKLICGSWGTLGVMTMCTVKVLPRAEKARTVLVFGLDWTAAGRAMTQALHTPYEVSGAAYLPARIAARSGVEYVREAGASVMAVRVEGFGPSVDYRCARLRELLGPVGGTEELHSANSAAFWQSVRDVMPFAGSGDSRRVWKLSVTPSEGPAIAGDLATATGGEAFLDWGGGLIWLAVPESAREDHATVRAIVDAVGGHATLIRADETTRTQVPVFDPQTDGMAALTRRVKSAFDPHGVLNPGRMYESL